MAEGARSISVSRREFESRWISEKETANEIHKNLQREIEQKASSERVDSLVKAIENLAAELKANRRTQMTIAMLFLAPLAALAVTAVVQFIGKT